MKIAIKFGDNDFIKTFDPIMDTLHKAYLYREELPTSKEHLLKIINNLSFSYYLLFQSRGYLETEKNYLQLDKSKLLLNEEVDDYLNSLESGYDNSSTFILDTELYNNNVYIV
jgi:hypothetical protein